MPEHSIGAGRSLFAGGMVETQNPIAARVGHPEVAAGVDPDALRVASMPACDVAAPPLTAPGWPRMRSRGLGRSRWRRSAAFGYMSTPIICPNPATQRWLPASIQTPVGAFREDALGVGARVLLAKSA